MLCASKDSNFGKNLYMRSSILFYILLNLFGDIENEKYKEMFSITNLGT